MQKARFYNRGRAVAKDITVVCLHEQIARQGLVSTSCLACIVSSPKAFLHFGNNYVEHTSTGSCTAGQQLLDLLCRQHVMLAHSLQMM